MTQPATAYDQGFYTGIRDHSRRSAGQLVPMLLEMFHPRSVVDVGCGDGTWLNSFRQNGITDVLGIDGDYVDRQTLQIPLDIFKAIDLAKPLKLDRRFDLAISLEVAEHLPPESAATFVKTLTELADRVIFSAAIPGQGGISHLNEQWPDYWAKLFLEQKFAAVDSLRLQIWNNPEVTWWYAQNVIIYERITADRPAEQPPLMPLPLVHPGLLETQKLYGMLQSQSRMGAVKSLFGPLVSAFRRR